jgi:hypothetical protein
VAHLRVEGPCNRHDERIEGVQVLRVAHASAVPGDVHIVPGTRASAHLHAWQWQEKGAVRITTPRQREYLLREQLKRGLALEVSN